jgi:hypothetical protein
VIAQLVSPDIPRVVFGYPEGAINLSLLQILKNFYRTFHPMGIWGYLFGSKEAET